MTKAVKVKESGSGSEQLQRVSNISAADLPWVSGVTLDQSALPPADFDKGCFSKEFKSPFQFGRRSSGRSCTHAKKTVEAAGFQFTFEAKAVFNKERAPYDPSQSLVSRPK